MNGIGWPLTETQKTLLQQDSDDYDPVGDVSTQLGGDIALNDFQLYVLSPQISPAEYQILANTFDRLHTACFNTPFAPNVYAPVGNTYQMGSMYVNQQLPTIAFIGAVGNQLLKTPIPDPSNPPKAFVFFKCFTDVSTQQTLCEIWSVCKDRFYAESNVFRTILFSFIDALRAQLLPYPVPNYFYLQVDSRKSTTMTEIGRLNLYTRSGFRIVPKTNVKIYSKIAGSVIQHIDANNLEVSIQKPNGLMWNGTVYVGSIESVDKNIEMVGDVNTIRTSNNEPLYHQSLKESVRVASDGQTYDIPIHMNEYPQNPEITLSPKSYLAMYHMRMVFTPSPESAPTFIKTMMVPSDFLIVTIAAPGSYLILNQQTAPLYFRSINQYIRRNTSAFVNRFHGYKTLPFHSPPPSATKLYTTYIANDQPINKETQQYGLFMQQFARKPIVNFCSNTRELNVKQSQIEFQVYLPGHTMIDFTVNRSTLNNPATEAGKYTERAARDDASFGEFMGMTEVEIGAADRKLDDTGFYNAPTKNLSDLVQVLQRQTEGVSGTKLLVLFGCAEVQQVTNDIENAFYEFSHKREIVHTFKYPETSEEFDMSMGRYMRGELPDEPVVATCSPLGGKTYRRKKRSKKTTYRKH